MESGKTSVKNSQYPMLEDVPEIGASEKAPVRKSLSKSEETNSCLQRDKSPERVSKLLYTSHAGTE